MEESAEFANPLWAVVGFRGGRDAKDRGCAGASRGINEQVQ